MERKQALQELENSFAQKQGRPPIVIQYAKMESDHYGDYLPHTNSLEINESLLMESTSYDTVATVIHEGRHAYQAHAMKHPHAHPNKNEVTLWKINNLDEIYQEEDPEYRLQPLERDAWNYEFEQTTQLFATLEKDLGANLGFQTYMDQFESYQQETQEEAITIYGENYLKQIDLTLLNSYKELIKSMKSKEKQTLEQSQSSFSSPNADNNSQKQLSQKEMGRFQPRKPSSPPISRGHER